MHNKVALLIIALPYFVMLTNHSILNEVGEHHHCSTLSVINQLPHVPSGRLHWTLSYDVSLLLLISLYTVTATIISAVAELLFCVAYIC